MVKLIFWISKEIIHLEISRITFKHPNDNNSKYNELKYFRDDCKSICPDTPLVAYTCHRSHDI